MREITADGHCKYAIIRLDKLPVAFAAALSEAVKCHNNPAISDRHAVLRFEVPTSAIELGEKNSKEEFFVIKLKDVNSYPALISYAESAQNSDSEFALDVFNMAQRAKDREDKKQPDTEQL